MVAPPKAEAAATTEVRAEQRHPVVDRPDEHSWGDRAAGPEQEVQATTAEEPVRPGPSVAVIGTAIRVLVSATEDDLMDSLETVRLKARARLASLFAQSVAEGHSAYDTAPASGADAFYDQEALVSALFDEKAVDDAIQVLSDSEVEGTHADPVRADPPPGQPKAKAPTVSSPPGLVKKAPPPPLPVAAPVAPVSKAAQKKAKPTDPQQLDPRDARQPAQPKVLSGPRSDSPGRQGPPDATFSLPTGAGARSVRGRRAAEDSGGQEPSDKAAGGVFNSPVSGSTGQAHDHVTAGRPVSRGANQAAGCFAVEYHYKTSVFPDGPVSYQVDD